MVNRVQTVIYPALFSRATAFFTHCSGFPRTVFFAGRRLVPQTCKLRAPMTDGRTENAEKTYARFSQFEEYERSERRFAPKQRRRMPRLVRAGMLVLVVMFSSRLWAQTSASVPPANTPAPANPWDFNVNVSGYLVPGGQSYFSPTFTGDHDTLHVEARYNYEAQHTGSLWVGYDLSVGRNWYWRPLP